MMSTRMVRILFLLLMLFSLSCGKSSSEGESLPEDGKITTSDGVEIGMNATTFSSKAKVNINDISSDKVKELFTKNKVEMAFDDNVTPLKTYEIEINSDSKNFTINKQIDFAIPASAIPASAIPASGVASAIPASAIPASAIPASMVSGTKYLTEEKNFQYYAIANFTQEFKEPFLANLRFDKSTDSIIVLLDIKKFQKVSFPTGTTMIISLMSVPMGANLVVGKKNVEELSYSNKGTGDVVLKLVNLEYSPENKPEKMVADGENLSLITEIRAKNNKGTDELTLEFTATATTLSADLPETIETGVYVITFTAKDGKVLTNELDISPLLIEQDTTPEGTDTAETPEGTDITPTPAEKGYSYTFNINSGAQVTNDLAVTINVEVEAGHNFTNVCIKQDITNPKEGNGCWVKIDQGKENYALPFLLNKKEGLKTVFLWLMDSNKKITGKKTVQIKFDDVNIDCSYLNDTYCGIPAGIFEMGNYDVGVDDKPLHSVTLGAYKISRYEISIGEYRKCVAAGKCEAPNSKDAELYFHLSKKYESFPMTNVTWIMADSYCKSVGGLLPTEAEWEFAAKGAGKRKFPWGSQDADESRVNFIGTPSYNGLGVQQVKSFESGASPFGVQNMAGNVWEWVADYYDSSFYDECLSDCVNPINDKSATFKVRRGGSYKTGKRFLNPAVRSFYKESLYKDDLGFRCVIK